MLPVTALIFRAEGLRVAVVRDGKAELVTVTLGRDFGTEVEVTSGITEHDQVIVSPPGFAKLPAPPSAPNRNPKP